MQTECRELSAQLSRDQRKIKMMNKLFDFLVFFE